MGLCELSEHSLRSSRLVEQLGKEVSSRQELCSRAVDCVHQHLLWAEHAPTSGRHCISVLVSSLGTGL